MSLPTAPSSTVPSHESPNDLATETSSAASKALESVPSADVGTSAGSSAGKTTKSQVEQAADKVFEQREGKEREG